MRQQAVFPAYSGDYQMTKMNAHGFMDMPPVPSRIPLIASDTTSGVSGQLPNIYVRAQHNSSLRAQRGDFDAGLV